MYNRHKDTQDSADLLDFFDHPQSRRQRQYEAVRAFIKERTPAEEVALRLGYTPATVYALVRDARAGKIRLFPEETSEKGSLGQADLAFLFGLTYYCSYL